MLTELTEMVMDAREFISISEISEEVLEQVLDITILNGNSYKYKIAQVFILGLFQWMGLNKSKKNRMKLGKYYLTKNEESLLELINGTNTQINRRISSVKINKEDKKSNGKKYLNISEYVIDAIITRRLMGVQYDVIKGLKVSDVILIKEYLNLELLKTFKKLKLKNKLGFIVRRWFVKPELTVLEKNFIIRLNKKYLEMNKNKGNLSVQKRNFINNIRGFSESNIPYYQAMELYEFFKFTVNEYNKIFVDDKNEDKYKIKINRIYKNYLD